LPVRLNPLTVKVCAAEAVPRVAVNAVSDADVAIDGGGTTVPLMATDLEVAPELVTEILPESAPAAAVAAIRTEIVVMASVPLLGVSVAVPV